MTTPHLMATACTAGDPDGAYRHAELAIWDELNRSLVAYPRAWGSAEEAAMILGEEVDELWDDVRANRIGCARAEAAQVGAMAVRFIADLYQPAALAVEHYRAAVGQQRAMRPEVGPGGRALASSHEGFGFLKREYDGLWSSICMGFEARTAAARVGAMAVRFIAEIASEAIAVDRTIQ